MCRPLFPTLSLLLSIIGEVSVYGARARNKQGQFARLESTVHHLVITSHRQEIERAIPNDGQEVVSGHEKRFTRSRKEVLLVEAAVHFRSSVRSSSPLQHLFGSWHASKARFFIDCLSLKLFCWSG